MGIIGNRAAMVALVLASGCDDGGPPEPIRFGILASLSGDLAIYGREVHDGTLLAIKEINDDGGINGHAITIEARDDGTIGDGARLAYGALLHDQVRAVIGPGFSAAVVALEDDLRTGRTITLSGSTTAPTLATIDDGGYFFRTVPGDQVQGLVLASLVAEAGVQSLCIVHRNDAYGNGLAGTLAAGLAITPVDVPYDPTAASLDRVLDDCEASRTGPDPGIAFITFDSDGHLIMDDAIARGWRTPATKIFLVDGNKEQQLFDALSDRTAFDGAFGTSPAGPDPSTPAGQRLLDFHASFLAQYERAPGVHAETNYDATYLAAAAIAIAGDDATPEQIRDAMAHTHAGTEAAAGDWSAIADAIARDGMVDYLGASGGVDLDDNGELEPPYYVAVWSLRAGAIEDLRVEEVGGGQLQGM